MSAAAGSSSSADSSDSGQAIPHADPDTRRFLVTGASSGIGLEIVKHLQTTRVAYDVVVRDRTAWDAVASPTPTAPPTLTPQNVFAVDLRDVGAVNRVADNIAGINHFYDVIICCAALTDPQNLQPLPAERQRSPALDDTFIVNVLSHYIIVQRILAEYGRRPSTSKPHVVTLATDTIKEYTPWSRWPSFSRSLQLPVTGDSWEAFYRKVNNGFFRDTRFWAYARSMAGCVLLAQLLAEEGQATAISVNLGNGTQLIEDASRYIYNCISRPIDTLFSLCVDGSTEGCVEKVMAATTHTDADAIRDHWMTPGIWNWPWEWMNGLVNTNQTLAPLPAAFHRPPANPPTANPNLGPLLSSFQSFLDDQLDSD